MPATALLTTLAGVLGLAIGSFLNVVIHRVPLGESVLRPASRCPSCQRPIRNLHNVPVLGWIMLRGRCADCQASISLRYPLVELVTGLLFAVVCWRLADRQLLAVVPAMLYFTAVGIALAVIDLELRRLPNAIVLPSYPVLVLGLAGAALVEGDVGALVRAGLGGLALFGCYLLLALGYPQGMGFGDVKLAGLLGLVLGYLSWSALLVGAFAGFALGAVVGVALIASGLANRKSAIPFGPFMITGALLAILLAGSVQLSALSA